MTPWGLLAEFRKPEQLLSAAREVHSRGYRQVEAYTPFPLDGLAEALGSPRSRVPLITLLGGLAGGALGYFLQYWSAVIDFPFNLGGRPLHSWPAFIPITFETTILGAALAAFFGMLLLNRMPRYYHPLHNLREFDLATRNRFFLVIRCSDRRYDPRQTRRLLNRLGAMAVCEVPP